MGKVFPRPKEIDFPESKNKYKIKMTSISSANNFEAQSEVENISFGRNIFLLKSGNILVSIDKINKEDLTIYSSLEIYTIPDLNLVEVYNFPNEKGDILYNISTAIQLKNGNIFAIRDKLYEFDSESIKNGPKRSSNKIKESKFEIKPLKFSRILTKDSARFFCDHITEIIDGKLLYTFTWNSYIYLLDCLNLDPDSKKILDTENSADLIFRSEINPKLLYICKNDFNVQNRKADLYAFDVNDFCDINKKEKKPLFNLRISNSRNVFGYCEYDNKYLLLDTVYNGIYIFDILTKTKVAVCDIKVENYIYKIYGDHKIRDYYCQKMLKLDDGQIFRIFPDPSLIDIREQRIEMEGCDSVHFRYIIKDNYLIKLYDTSLISSSLLYE